MIENVRRALVGAIAGITMSGCALFGCPPTAEPVVVVEHQKPVAVPKPDDTREREEVVELLAYYQGLLGLGADDLRREYTGASQSFARDRTERTRLRLALVMSVPGAAWRDDAKLLTLLEGAPARGSAAESPRRYLVSLLQRMVSERLREQRRADALQQKLDAILEIERKLRSRQPMKPQE